MHDGRMSTDFYPMTPKQLGRELGHNDGASPGITVRNYLRKTYPDHPKGARWLLTREQADDARRHFGASTKSVSPHA